MYPSADPDPAHASGKDGELIRRFAQGELIGGGVSGIIERLPNGLVLKSPWPGPEEDEFKADIKLEVRAYHRLAQYFGPHKRFMTFVTYDVASNTITTPYMTHGTLGGFMKSSRRQITQVQRHKGILAKAEDLELLHAAGILHCDFGPQNLLLDEELELKVADLACCSMNEHPSSDGGSTRFYLARTSWRSPITTEHDLFALGSSIYEVATGQAPYEDLPSPNVRHLFRLNQFPDLVGVEAGDVIIDCWLSRANSASAVRRRLLATMGTSISVV